MPTTTKILDHAANIADKDDRIKFLKECGIDDACINILEETYTAPEAVSELSLEAGDKVKYAGLVCTFVETKAIGSDTGYRFYIDNVLKDVKFGSNNNYEGSDIQKEINEFSVVSRYNKNKLLYNIKTADLFKFNIDLKTQDGMDDYNTSSDNYINLLTMAEYTENRDILGSGDKYILATGYSAVSNKNHLICNVNSDGTLGESSVYELSTAKLQIILKGDVEVTKITKE